MARNYQLLIVFGTIAAMILLIGCGQSTTTGTTGLSTATPAPSPRATNAPTRTANTGKVTLHVDAPSYRTHDTISVTLNNQSNQTISFTQADVSSTIAAPTGERPRSDRHET